MYKVQVLEEDQQPGFTRNIEKSKGKETSRQCGSFMDVQCGHMRCVSLFLSAVASLIDLPAETASPSLSPYFGALFVIVWTVMLLLLPRGL